MFQVIFLTGEGGRLRKNLVRGRDFELVPEAVWRALSQWYGGSPPLPRQVCILQCQWDIVNSKLMRPEIKKIKNGTNSNGVRD